MSLAEINRQVDSFNRVYKNKLRERAVMDYKLADLICISVSRLMSSENNMPQFYEVYSDLLEKEGVEQMKQEQLDKLSVARFMTYAAAHNLKFKGGQRKNDEQ